MAHVGTETAHHGRGRTFKNCYLATSRLGGGRNFEPNKAGANHNNSSTWVELGPQGQ
jgi:hypothetical protein